MMHTYSTGNKQVNTFTDNISAEQFQNNATGYYFNNGNRDTVQGMRNTTITSGNTYNTTSSNDNNTSSTRGSSQMGLRSYMYGNSVSNLQDSRLAYMTDSRERSSSTPNIYSHPLPALDFKNHSSSANMYDQQDMYYRRGSLDVVSTGTVSTHSASSLRNTLSAGLYYGNDTLTENSISPRRGMQQSFLSPYTSSLTGSNFTSPVRGLNAFDSASINSMNTTSSISNEGANNVSQNDIFQLNKDIQLSEIQDRAHMINSISTTSKISDNSTHYPYSNNSTLNNINTSISNTEQESTYSTRTHQEESLHSEDKNVYLRMSVEEHAYHMELQLQKEKLYLIQKKQEELKQMEEQQKLELQLHQNQQQLKVHERHSVDSSSRNSFSYRGEQYRSGSPSFGYDVVSPWANEDSVESLSRTVYLGNVPEDVTYKQILDYVRCGDIEESLIIQRNACAFITFVDSKSALTFHSEAILKKLEINGQPVKVGWGKKSQLDPITAAHIKSEQASRNVFIGNLFMTQREIYEQHDPNVTSFFSEIDEGNITRRPKRGTANIYGEEQLKMKLLTDLVTFGPIETLKLIPEKGIAFVHFTSIKNAIKTVSTVALMNPYYKNKKIGYGKDRCSFVTKTQKHNAFINENSPSPTSFDGESTSFHTSHYMTNISNDSNSSLIDDRMSTHLLNETFESLEMESLNTGVKNVGNRTIFIGNLPKGCKITEVCNVVKGGMLEKIKYFEDKHMAFITFIDPNSAAQFYQSSKEKNIVIFQKVCKIGWGKNPGCLSDALNLMIKQGASRNIYIGNINFGKFQRNEELNADTSDFFFNENNLYRFIRKYGEVEQINFLIEKNCCFVNFMNISDAIIAIDKIKEHPNFQNLKINFGKDRCANQPRRDPY